MSRRTPGLLFGALLAVLVLPSAALAVTQVPAPAPVTSSLRIEGPTRTLFDGPVTTGVRTFDFTGGSAASTCDGTAATGGPSLTPVVTRGAAIAKAISDGLSAVGTFGQYGATFTTIDGDSVAYNAMSGAFLIEFLNGQSSMLGACSEQIHDGDEAVFGYGAYTARLLKLTAPATAAPGQTVSGVVSHADDGTKVAGATIGSASSGADGSLTIGPFTDRGNHDVKAEKTGDIRSNRVRICVTDGADGFCGTTKPGAPPAPAPVDPPPLPPAAPDTTPALPTIGALAEQAKFTVAKAPRELKGTVATDASGLRDVLLSLTRRSGKRCERYDGAREAWVRLSPCGAEHGVFFSVGAKPEWSYLLPQALTPGRYVLDVRTVDGAGNLTRGASRGGTGGPRTRVVFFVR